MAEAHARRAEIRSDHLRALDAPERRAKYAQISDDIARVLGPNRSAAQLYGYLASAWYEYASADALRAIAAKTGRSKTPGDWVSIAYSEFMTFMGTGSKDSVTRWVRILAEETHACPWSRCADEHPLIVIKRLGQSRPNQYRRWNCGEDVVVIKPRVRSRKLAEVARRRNEAGEILNGHVTRPATILKPDERASEIELPFASEARSSGFKSPEDRSPRSPMNGLQEVRPPGGQKPDERASLRVKSPKSLRATAERQPQPVAAVERIDEVDAVACEIIDAILELAQRIDPAYTDQQAWDVSRKLAASLITHVGGDAESARPLLLLAIADRRLQRADNPIGLLVRGICGNAEGVGRFLIPATQPFRPAAAADVVAPRPDDAAETRRRIEAEENRRLDERAEAYLNSLEEPAVEKLRAALRVHLTTKFGSFNPRQPIARPMLINFVKHQIREGLI